MDNVIQTIKDGLGRLLDWCMGNKKTALAAAGCVLLVFMMISVMFCGSRKLDGGVDELNGTEWSYHADGRLKFSGTGDVVGQNTVYGEGESVTEQPVWYDYKDKIIAIEIGEEIASVGMDSFVEFNALRTVTVKGAQTEMDVECIRYESAEGWENYPSITVYGVAGSPAQSYAEFNGLTYSELD